MSMKLNISARNEYTRRITGHLNAAEASAALFGQFDTDRSHLTYDDVQKLYERVWANRGRSDAQVLLQRFGLSHIRGLPLSMYREFVDYANVVIYYQISPACAWTNKYDVPSGLRGRWLLHHEGSDALFVLTDQSDAERSLASGEADDVTGVDHFERLYEDQL